jgi:hypothetical protein
MNIENYGYNGHEIVVEEYQDYIDIENDVKEFFYAISVDGEFAGHGYLTAPDAKKAAEDYIDNDLANL